MTLNERAQNKALSNIVELEREIREKYVLLETQQIGSLTTEQFESVIEYKERELEVWKLILNKVQ